MLLLQGLHTLVVLVRILLRTLFSLQAKRQTRVVFPTEWLKNGGGRDVCLPASAHQAA
jgi:hypothetical protein